MRILFKKFRDEELAVKLNLSVSTIYKWRTKRNTPSRLAQEKIDALIKDLQCQKAA